MKILGYLVVALVIIIVGAMTIPITLPVISVSAEHLFYLGPISITNSLLTSWIVVIIATVLFFVGTSNMQLRPSGLQNFLEWVVEGIYNLTVNVAGVENLKRFPAFFTVPATIFIYVIISNWFALFPGLPLLGVGLCQEIHHEENVEGGHSTQLLGSVVYADSFADEEEHKSTSTCAEGSHLVPFVRSPSADLSNTFALAIITQLLAQYFGFAALGSGYLSKFLIIKPEKGAMAIIDFLVGLLEFVSEFIKVVAYTFRLFGNIFAGEVTVFVLIFFMPLLGALPMLGFEIFVGFIQAFVFYILSVAFYTIAVKPHDHEEAH